MFHQVVRRKDLKEDGLFPPTDSPYDMGQKLCQISLEPNYWDKPRDSILLEDCPDEFNLLIKLDGGLWTRVVNIDFESYDQKPHAKAIS